MVGDEPVPSIVTVPFVGDSVTDHDNVDTSVSVSVAFNSTVLQDAIVSSSITLLIGAFPCEITGAWLLLALIEAANASRLPRLVRSEEPKLAVPLKIPATTAMLLLFEAIFLG